MVSRLRPHAVRRPDFRLQTRPRWLTLAVLATLAPVAGAQQLAPLAVDNRLLLSAQLGPVVGAQPAAETTVIDADRLTGRNDVELRAAGDVRLRRGEVLLETDRLRYDQIRTEATAEGQVRFSKNADFIEGPRATINLDTYYGQFDSPLYTFTRTRGSAIGGTGVPVTGSGQAELLRLEGENQYRLTNATYSTCPAPEPDWYLKVRDLELDYDRQQGEGTHTTLVFKDVPVAYVPWAQFPLDGGRQSGLLPPTFGSTSATGVDLTVPFYWNIAPNYDATLAPRYMSRRGLQLNGEFRYLQPDYYGTLTGEFLAHDQVTEESRGYLGYEHFHNFGSGLSGTIDYNEVSDDDYFADFSSRIGTTSQATLTQQATLAYNNGSWLASGLNFQRFQTLSGPVPYNRVPQVTARVNVPYYKGLAFTLPAEYTRFEHPTLDEGQRTVLYPQVAYPVQGAAYFFTPKLGMHMAHYALERQSTSGPQDIARAVPIFTADAGLIFERDVDWRGRSYIQTLQPRLYYVRSGYRDQSEVPVFDTARADFNFAQLFSENVYSGNDRIADANQLTVGVSSTLSDAETGVEWLRGAIGQRYYFRDQRVTLPGEAPRSGRVADWLGSLSGRVWDDLWLDAAYQYDPREHRSERGTFGVRFQPDFAKVLSVSYRYKRGEFRDLDIAGQWPLMGNWYGVGRYNRNLRDHRLTEAIAGLEYKADCWVFRSVWQTLVTTRETRNNAFFLQIELNGLASIGSSPVQLLSRSIGGYGRINEPGVGDPVFGNSAGGR